MGVPAIDVSSLTALDVHTHVHRSVRASREPAASGHEDMGEYFRIGKFSSAATPQRPGTR